MRDAVPPEADVLREAVPIATAPIVVALGSLWGTMNWGGH